MNATAKRPEWMTCIEHYAQHRTTAGLPSLEAEFGPGHWKVDSNRQRITKDGLLCYYVYWLDSTGRHHRIGTFEAPPIARPPGKQCVGSLTLGFDDCGRRLVRITVDKFSKQYRIIAVEWDVVRGVRLPRPIPVQEVQGL